jgi:hypothetical protein
MGPAGTIRLPRPVSASRRILAAVALIGLLAVASGCDQREDVVTEAEDMGRLVDVGPLQYQIQISRPLNPSQRDDAALLRGVEETEDELEPGEAWFGVFVRITNQTDEPHRSAPQFELIDTEENEFRPVRLPDANPFAYRVETVLPDDAVPGEDSPAAQMPIGGQLLLFRVDVDSLENRPLELRIRQPGVQPSQAVVDLDV